MDKGIECGVRFEKSILDLSDADFNDKLSVIISQMENSIFKQRVAYQNEIALIMAKSGNDSFSSKTVEIYCSSKGSFETVDMEEKGIECGIRIKQFALDLSDDAFKVYTGGCMGSFKTSVLEQRKIYLEVEAEKSVQLDQAMKGVEIYCRSKSFCA